MTPVKIILLCGGAQLALPALKALAFSQLLAAVVIPDHCIDMLEEVTGGLNGSGIPVITVNKTSVEEKLKQAVMEYEASLGLVITFSFKIPASVFTLPKFGFYNVHPGPLPSYRGPDPVFRQIKNQEKFAGVSIHQVSDAFDAGPVFLTESIMLEKTDTHGMLSSKLGHLCAKMVMVLIKIVAFEMQVPLKQQDPLKAVYYKKQGAKEVCVNWETMDAASIVALINACNPWNKGVSVRLNGQLLKLLGAENVVDKPELDVHNPGSIISVSEQGMLVAAAGNSILKVKLISCSEGFLHPFTLRKFYNFEDRKFDTII